MARQFDGSDDRVSCGDVASMEGISRFTVAFWLKPEEDGPDWGCYLGKIQSDGTSGGTSGWSFQKLAAQYGDAIDFMVADGNWDQLARINITEWGTWKHYVIVYDGTQATQTDRLKLYINGQATSWSDGFWVGLASSVPNTNAPFEMGRVYNGASYDYAKGSLAEVVFWSGTAFSSGQVSTLYGNEGYPLGLGLPSPSVYYDLYSTIYDQTGNTSPSTTGTTQTTHPNARRHNVTAAHAGLGEAAGNMGAEVGLSAAPAGLASASATIASETSIAVGAFGLGTVSAAVGAECSIAVAAVGLGTVSTALSLEVSIVANEPGLSAMGADLTYGSQVDVAAVLSGVGAVTATLGAEVSIGAGLEGLAACFASLGAEIGISSSPSGSGSMAAATAFEISLVAAHDGFGLLSAALETEVAVALEVTGNGSCTATLGFPLVAWLQVDASRGVIDRRAAGTVRSLVGLADVRLPQADPDVLSDFDGQQLADFDGVPLEAH